ncbi:MAG: hypothetical protein DDT36_00124 [Firmicutes bacterium]|nr:hypothetical protein [Bacillota bacterium]
MKRILILTLILTLLALPASGMLKILDPAIAAELELIARTHVATERNIPLAQVVVADPWLLELRGLEMEVYVIPLVIREEKVTAYVRVKDKAILTEKEVDTLKGEEAALMTKSDRAFITTLAAAEVAVPTETPTSMLPYALAGGLATVALGAGLIIVKRKKR